MIIWEVLSLLVNRHPEFISGSNMLDKDNINLDSETSSE